MKSLRTVFKKKNRMAAEGAAVTAVRRCDRRVIKWLNDMKIQHKLFLAFGVLISTLAFVSVLSGYQLYNVDKKYSELITSTIGRQTSIAQAISEMKQIYSMNSTKGYLFTVEADPDVMDALHTEYIKRTESFLKNISEYCRILLSDKNLSPVEKQEFLSYANEILYMFKYSYHPIIEKLDESLYNDLQETYQAIYDSMNVGDEIIQKMNYIYSWASATAEEISASTTSDSYKVILVLYALTLLFGLLSTLLSRSLTRRINTPILQMKTAMLEISRGNLSHPIRMDQKDELGILSNKIGDMVDNLKNSHAELQLALDAAEDSSKVKSEFLNNMNHELRTPMNGILGFHRMALQTDLTGEQRKYITEADNSAKSLLNIIDDMLDFTETISSKIIVNAKCFKLSDVVEEVLDSHAPAINAKNLEYNLRLSSDLPEQVTGDQSKLKRILSALIDNAVKFTERGKISVRVNLEKQTDKYYEISFYIRDTGIGIKPDQTKHLFEPFWRADSSLTRKQGGTGFGLPLSKQLAALLGGKIWVESEYEEGSTFHFTARFGLPGALDSATVNTQESELPHAEPDECKYPPHNSHLLIVEDVEINQIIAEELLTGIGYTVDIANNGQEALDMLAENNYAAILMDIQMPVMDGLTATAKIRELDDYRDLPIIAVSAHAMDEDREKSLAHGMNDHITKPLDQEVLIMTLNKWLKPA